MSFKEQFEQIVLGIAKEAQAQATCFADRIEALKALNVSYGLMMKFKKDDADDDSDEFSFDKPIAEEPKNGAGKVRTRPRGN